MLSVPLRYTDSDYPFLPVWYGQTLLPKNHITYSKISCYTNSFIKFESKWTVIDFTHQLTKYVSCLRTGYSYIIYCKKKGGNNCHRFRHWDEKNMSVALEQGTVTSCIAKKKGGNNCHRFRHEMTKICQLPEDRGQLYYVLQKKKIKKKTRKKKPAPII